MIELVFLLEERSAKVFLAEICRRLLGESALLRFIAFEGKQDLERNLARKIRSYQNPAARFLVLRDQDREPDCRALKSRLLSLCEQTERTGILVRIACRELESFYLADLAAVEKGLGVPNLGGRQNRKNFRAPDRLHSPKRELARLTSYRYQPVGGSRAIAPWMRLDNRRSPSFGCLIDAIHKLSEGA